MAKLIIAESYNDSNMFYAVRVLVPDAFIYVEADKRYVLVNKLEYDRMKAQVPKNITVVAQDKYSDSVKKEHGKVSLELLAHEFLKEKKISSVQVPANFPVKYADSLRSLEMKVKVIESFFPERIIKSASEIKEIEKVQRVIENATHHALDILKKSKAKEKNFLYFCKQKITSEYLKRELMIAFMDGGVEGADLIISHGSQSAFPHHSGSGHIKAGEPIVMDIFPRSSSQRYFSDMTRTVCKGKPKNPLVEKLYNYVLEAQEAGYSKIKEGSSGDAVHKAVVDTFKKYHLEKYFTHGTGHGVGIDIHESPKISPGGQELKTGMVITNEPGLYIQGVGGVRIEDTLVVTKTGYKILTKMPKKLII